MYHYTPTRMAKITQTDRKVWPLLGMCHGTATTDKVRVALVNLSHTYPLTHYLS